MRRTKVARSAAVAAAVLAILAATPPAVADDHEPPRTTLLSRGVAQEGRLGTRCWIYPVPGGWVQECIDTIPDWPRAEPARAGAAASIVIEKAERPVDLAIQTWRRVDKFGFPRSQQHDLKFELRRRLYRGEPAWEAVFRLPRRPGHLYLSLFGIWEDTEVAPGEPQDARWFFHLRLGA